MSYDVQIWSVSPVSLPEGLPDRSAWQQSEDNWTREGPDWQILVYRSNRVLPEDVPEEASQCLPGIGYLTELSLAPIGARRTAKQLLARVATGLARPAHGVVLDPQRGTVTTPRGLKRFVTPGPSESASVLSLSWWFVGGSLAERADAGELLDVLTATLPEARPRRYGLYEPPQHVYAETGERHLRAFLQEHARGIGVVWYPHPPVAHVHLSIPERIGGTRMGFRSGRFMIDVDTEALSQPGWDTALQTAWRRISRVIQPFYGDVRTLRGLTRSRGRYWIGPDAERHPVCGWWWAGIPIGPVHALVIGEPYRALWPAFVATAQPEDGLHFLPTDSWASSEDALSRCGPPPADIAQPIPEHDGLRTDRPYPPVWPFGAPRDPA